MMTAGNTLKLGYFGTIAVAWVDFLAQCHTGGAWHYVAPGAEEGALLVSSGATAAHFVGSIAWAVFSAACPRGAAILSRAVAAADKSGANAPVPQ